MAHSNHEIREVKGPFGETTYRSYCSCGHRRRHTTRLSAELDLADHLMTVMEEAVGIEPDANFIDTYHDEREIERRQFGPEPTISEWRRKNEVRREEK